MNQPLAILAALADPTRLRCIALLAPGNELCVCQLVHALDEPQPKISRHLAALRDAGLLTQRRVAQWTLYRIADLPPWAGMMLRGAALALADDPSHRADGARLATAPAGPPAPQSPAAARPAADPPTGEGPRPNPRISKGDRT